MGSEQIERWKMIDWERGKTSKLIVCDDGDFVRHADHVERIAELQACVKEAEGSLDDIDSEVPQLFELYECTDEVDEDAPVPLYDRVIALRERAEKAERERDDLEREAQQGRYALDNSRCPGCGCATPDEADANECGCGDPVCAIEAPETLAEAYVRVCGERDELAEKLAALKSAADRVAGVSWCSEREPMAIPNDPLRAALDGLREAFAKLDGEQGAKS